MNRRGSLAAAMVFCASLAAGPAGAQAHPDSHEPAGVTISLLEQNVTDKVLRLRYQIRNGSKNDIWICVTADERRGQNFIASVEQDSEILFVKRRHEMPANDPGSWPAGRYVCLRSGETRSEVMSLSLPVYFGPAYFDPTRSLPPERAKRLVLAIGYCEGDLPARVSGVFDQRERVWDEEIVVPVTDRALNGEKDLCMVVEDVAIPYHRQYRRPAPIHLSPCRQIEVHFRRSPLEFFFPYAQQQALLSPNEKRYLQSLKDLVLEDMWDLMGIAYDVSEATGGAFFTERSMVGLTCHRRNGSVVSLTVYDDAYIVTQEGQVFRCLGGLTRLRMLTPLLESLDLRVRCAANLRELWYRIRKYHPRYFPRASAWCDAIGVRGQACPGSGEGRCHYAMNPYCRPDSPADMVLLFETRAGWNQHGGPELFTLKNHDPPGGCVLLSDGTVKFIRTREEVRRLRWE